MISSAVIIPEQESEQRPHSPPLKRRQSSIFSDSNKRLRLNTQDTDGDGAQSISAEATSPPSKKRSTIGVGAAEEKKRGQRLFGALLGTLSQRSARPAHKKRDEIEQRQRERLRKDTEEQEEVRRRQRDELDQARRVEQKAWEVESMRIRHRNMRATAGFLRTTTEPSLFYKPWELREKEEQLIKRQIKDVEDKIQVELNYTNGKDDPRSTKDQDNRDLPDVSRNTGNEETKDQDNGSDVDMSKDEQQVSSTGDVDVAKASDPKQPGSTTPSSKPAEDERPKEDEHAGEELVEGQEDDVIY